MRKRNSVSRAKRKLELTEAGAGTTAATARTMMRKGNSGAKNIVSIASILPEPNWKSEGKRGGVLQPIESAFYSTEKNSKKGVK